MHLNIASLAENWRLLVLYIAFAKCQTAYDFCSLLLPIRRFGKYAQFSCVPFTELCLPSIFRVNAYSYMCTAKILK